METLPNISNFCTVKVLGNQTSLVSTKSGHLCIMRQYTFKDNVILDDHLNKWLSDFKNAISSHLLLQIDYFFAHLDTLYVVYEYCEGGSVCELQQRITLYNDNLYESELVSWFVQMLASVNELICKDILKFCDNSLDVNLFYFKNNSIKLDTSKILLNYLLYNIPLLKTKQETSTIPNENISTDSARSSLAGESVEQKILRRIVCQVYELAAHQRVDFFDKEHVDNCKVDKCANELPLLLREIWIRLAKFEIAFPDIMDHPLIKEILAEECSYVPSDDPLIFNVENLKYKEATFGGSMDQSSFDFEAAGLNEEDIAELIKDL